MPINFAQLFQDSWNFMRNQSHFSLFALGLVLLAQIGHFFATPQLSLSSTEADFAGQGQDLPTILPTLLFGVLNLLITILIILNIRQINQGQFKSFFAPLGQSLAAFFPVVVITIVSAIPLSIGFAMLLTSRDLAILALPVLITGVFVFIKFSLAHYVYLLESPQRGIGQTLKETWGLSRGKMFPLILFCVINYMLPSILLNLLTASGNQVVDMLALLVNAFISVFTLIFSFRFYQVYRQGA
ncbi:hypothetical protein A4G20_08610 [Pasteurellaceae bacterium RH1A]|nr:hypothetical protein A4G20_08610 [Pasteurellaceae bacterium RH1A]